MPNTGRAWSIAIVVTSLLVAAPAAAAPVAEGPAPADACENECEDGERCSAAGRCERIDPLRYRFEKKFKRGRTALIVGGAMLGGGALAFGVGAAVMFGGPPCDESDIDSCDNDGLGGAFLMVGGGIAAAASLVVLGVGAGLYVNNRKTLRLLDAERRVSLRPSLRANPRSFGAGLDLEVRF